jgi:hypothetical protein
VSKIDYSNITTRTYYSQEQVDELRKQLLEEIIQDLKNLPKRLYTEDAFTSYYRVDPKPLDGLLTKYQQKLKESETQ